MMNKLCIKPDFLLEDIDLEFRNYFPHLKLVFFNSKANTLIPAHHQHDQLKGKIVSEVNKKLKSIVIDFEDVYQTHVFEKMLSNLLNLNVQVFRKSGDGWIETHETDFFTLNQQNEEAGKSIRKRK